MKHCTGSVELATMDDIAMQSALLQDVSTTYALTIPQLPDPLRDIVGNAYLLCRIADSIEDEPALDLETKRDHLEHFVEVVAGREDAVEFTRKLSDCLTSATPEAERTLATNAHRVVRITHGFSDAQRRSIERCIAIMAEGMIEFQQIGSPSGLADMALFERYCYVVAGVVAEMLAALFCDHAHAVREREQDLMSLSISYGQGLQMTNIVNDIWTDLENGACWLPRDLFAHAGFDLDDLSSSPAPAFAAGLAELVSLTHEQLTRGLHFILLIPRHQRGIRRHLLWTVGLAVLTLRALSREPQHRRAPSAAQVRMMMFVTSAAASSDLTIKLLFASLTRHLRPLRTQMQAMMRW